MEWGLSQSFIYFYENTSDCFQPACNLKVATENLHNFEAQ